MMLENRYFFETDPHDNEMYPCTKRYIYRTIIIVRIEMEISMSGIFHYDCNKIKRKYGLFDKWFIEFFSTVIYL